MIDRRIVQVPAGESNPGRARLTCRFDVGAPIRQPGGRHVDFGMLSVAFRF